MYVARDFGKVRIVHDGSPFDKAYDIVVETLDADGTWKFYSGYNSLSNDYAHASANEAAGRAIKKLAAEAASALPGIKSA